MRQLGPGIYQDGDTVHFNVREMCKELRWPYTRRNINVIEASCLAAFQQTFGAPPATVLIVEVPPQEEVN
jgi:hypothetical protein